MQVVGIASETIELSTRNDQIYKKRLRFLVVNVNVHCMRTRTDKESYVSGSLEP